jgi:dTDP-glucose 4,6-dehydratase
LGTQFELSVLDLARLVLRITGSNSVLEYYPLPADDPTRRRPVLTRAEERLGWRPQISVEEGLRRMVEWFQSCRDEVAAAKLAISGGPLEKTSRTLVSAGVNSVDEYASTHQ